MKNFLVILSLLFITACAPDPPKLTAKVNEKLIKVYQGSYCWNEYGQGVCADTISPVEMVKKDAPTVVPKGSELKLRFNYEPKKESIGASIWINGEARDQKIVNSDTIVLPKEPGIYVYSVHANWKEGDSSYALQVEVK
jgi:hypothetical protein